MARSAVARGTLPMAAAGRPSAPLHAEERQRERALVALGLAATVALMMVAPLPTVLAAALIAAGLLLADDLRRLLHVPEPHTRRARHRAHAMALGAMSLIVPALALWPGQMAIVAFAALVVSAGAWACLHARELWGRVLG